MASFFFEDYHFPSELYNRETGDFTAPIRTLLDFAPHILQELPKQEKDQKPIHSEAQDSWTKKVLPSTGYLSALLNSEKTRAVSDFIIQCGTEYMKTTSERKREEERLKRFKREEKERKRRENQSSWFFKREISSSSEDEEEVEQKLQKEKEKKEKKEKERSSSETMTTKSNQEEVSGPSSATTNNAIMTSAVAASMLSLSLYSTYQASVNFSDISFHNQLELIISQVESIIQSTEVWIEEHEKMGDKVPNQVRTDLMYIKELVANLINLDPRANKRVEAAGWGVGAVGGLSALGGFVLGSTAVLTGGTALALGGVITMVSAKAHSAGKSQLGARLLMENQVREKVKACQKNEKEREKLIQNGFEVPVIPDRTKRVHVNAGDKRKIHEDPLENKTTTTTTTTTTPSRKKEKVAALPA
ncbi:hypothetical protein BD770DRAFT_475648 [Pilaira anomala]|nr:hypothetical protein BD770DRAFT_475648 [Pilaira anomala]